MLTVICLEADSCLYLQLLVLEVGWGRPPLHQPCLHCEGQPEEVEPMSAWIVRNLTITLAVIQGTVWAPLGDTSPSSHQIWGAHPD